MDKAVALLDAAVACGDVSAACLRVARGGFVFSRSFGAARSPDSVFLVASLTKPMTAAAVMTLVDAGDIALSDAVSSCIPEFTGGSRGRVKIRDILAHTSGLPDMLPENIELRTRHAPLSAFVAGSCRAPLLFEPGFRYSYQSMGTLLAAEIVQRAKGIAFREFLRETVFEPLGMAATSLGLGGRRIAATERCQTEAPSDWDWNSPYWRDLGAPWGGAHSTTGDIAAFIESFLHPDGRVLRRATAAQMIIDQNGGLDHPHSFGWAVKPGMFGAGCSPRTFGHFGATGTMAWADPDTGLSCVLLTTRPLVEPRDVLHIGVSEAVARAVTG